MRLAFPLGAAVVYLVRCYDRRRGTSRTADGYARGISIRAHIPVPHYWRLSESERNLLPRKGSPRARSRFKLSAVQEPKAKGDPCIDHRFRLILQLPTAALDHCTPRTLRSYQEHS